MKIKRLAVLFASVVFTSLIIIAGCSLDVPKSSSDPSLTINLKNAESSEKNVMEKAFETLISGPSLPGGELRLMSSGPTSLADFSCFAVDIAGTGIPADSGNQISNCTVQSSIAVGFIPNPVTTGQSIQASVPAGPARTIYAFGVYPSANGCGGSSGGSGSSGGGGGYLLGQVTQDLLTSASITIPISYTNGVGPAVSCSGHNNSGGGCTGLSYPNQFFPLGGVADSADTILVNAIGTYGGSTVTVGGASCTGFTDVDSAHFACTTPANLTGPQSVVVTDPCGNVTNLGSFTFTNAPFLAIADGQDAENYYNADNTSYSFGTNTSGATHTFTLVNFGGSASTINTYSITGSGSSAYTIPSGNDGCSGTTLQAYGTSPYTCTFAVNLGTAAGTFNATITYTDTSSVSATRNVTGTNTALIAKTPNP